MDALKPGDLIVLPDGDGRWGRVFEFVRMDEAADDRLLVRDRGGAGRLWSVLASKVVRPGVVPPDPHDEPVPDPVETMDHEPQAADSRISNAQRRALFGRARELGLDVDDLRAMTRGGHISSLTRVEAADLIRRLSGPAVVWRSQGTATGKQLGLIALLRGQLAFTDDQFTKWLMGRRFGVTRMEQISDQALASRIIGGLIGMRDKRAAERHRGGVETEHRKAGAGG